MGSNLEKPYMDEKLRKSSFQQPIKGTHISSIEQHMDYRLSKGQRKTAMRKVWIKGLNGVLNAWFKSSYLVGSWYKILEASLKKYYPQIPSFGLADDAT